MDGGFDQNGIDPHALVDVLCSVDPELSVAVISKVLAAKPELAPAVVTYACPELTYAPSLILSKKRSSGCIKSYSADKGYGFIACPELQEVFGCDVFVHKAQMSNCQVGQQVTFAIVLNKDNKPQAFDLASLGGANTQNAAAMMGAPTADPMQMQMMMMGMMHSGVSQAQGGLPALQSVPTGTPPPGGNFVPPPKSAASKPPEQSLGEVTGTIKSFSVDKGFGFISSPDVREMGYSNDVFLHNQHKGEFEVGSYVAFSLYLNSKGQPQAKDLKFPPGDDGAKRARLF
jgi:cold shock CspA family protein